MNRIDKKFIELRAKKRKAFIAYITAGDPNLTSTKRIALELEKSGVDILELGIPFSDPIADGPIIQAASHRALRGGVKLKKIFDMVIELRASTDMPIVFMTYYNPILRYGLDKFIISCRKCGVDGVIVPDLPFEEASDLIKCARLSGVATIFLASPTSTVKRIRHIVEDSRGFIYYVSLTGVTGTRSELPVDVISKIRAVKSATDKPVAVGFGVSNSEQASRIARVADGVIVGSAIVKLIGEDKGAMVKVPKLAKSLANAIHGV